MPETGQIAVFTGPGRPFEIREFEVPEPEPGCVLVKVTTANICGSDLHYVRGYLDKSGGDPLPFARTLGHEMTGTVARLGDGVTADYAGKSLAVGDQIVYRYFNPCGKCRCCQRQSTPRCPYALPRWFDSPDKFPHFHGAFCQYFYLSPGQTIFKVTADISEDLLAPANCALSQVIYGFRKAKPTPDDHVVIQGAGGLGLNAIAVAKELGVRQIIVADAIDERLELAKAFGADELIDLKAYPDAKDRAKRVRTLTDGWGADIVMEVAGHPDAFPEGLDMLGNGGTYVVIGTICRGRTCTADPGVLVQGGKTVLGVMWYDPSALSEAIDLLGRCGKKYPFDKVLSHHYPLSAINEAIAEQDAGRIQRTALRPWDDA